MAAELPVGKLDPTLLEKHVFKYKGAENEDIILGPVIGGDAAALKVKKPIIVFKSDPIVGASKSIGKLAINIVSNDIACLGAKPVAVMLVLLMPEGSKISDIEIVMREAHYTAKKLGISIVGGHTEIAQGLRNRPPLVIASAIGEPVGDNIIKSGGAMPGDLILMTKTAGLEGTAIIAETFEDKLIKIIGRDIIERAKKLGEKTSVVNEALALAKLNLATSMHDPTDGGLIEGLYEISMASGKGFIVYENKIPIAKETLILSKIYNFDPLKLISSGVLLATIPRNRIKDAIDVLEEIGISYSIIGEIIDKNVRKLIRNDGRVEYIDAPVVDELWRILETGS